ncbi:MAG: tRNA-dihydrouridine synthase family protein [Bacteroidales bacterium]|nr:tRNA-dihydrouridine synthase family protein [Bacteroidales bacterium]
MILAPMQGLTEVLFRRVYEECFPEAVEKAVAPFLSLTHNLHQANPRARALYLRDVLPENNEGSIPVIPQILGKEPDEFVELDHMLYDLGYREVNWNMGCPMRAVTGKHRGSGILPYPGEVRAMLEAVVPKMKCRLSVKMRLGLRDKREIFDIIPILNDYPLASVTVHPRTGKQQYGGMVDLETFAEVLPMVKAPVIYNGDICTVQDIRRIETRFPQVSDIMVGRGLLYDPALPLKRRQDDGTARQRDDKTKRFIRRLMEEIKTRIPQEEARLRKTKEYWSLLWKSLPISEMQAREVLRAQDAKLVDNLIEGFTQ